MTDDEYQALLARVYSGQVLVGIDRTAARSFFSEVPISLIKDKTGEAPYLQKIIVVGAQFLGQALLLVSFVFAIFAFSWWADLPPIGRASVILVESAFQRRSGHEEAVHRGADHRVSERG
jgi:hypothetical protein